MKISELETARAADVLCELTPYIASITRDEVLLGELGRKVSRKGKTTTEIYTYMGQKISVLLPIFLKEHRTDVFGILAALQGTDVETIAKQPLMTTMEQVKELVEDKDLIDFFKSFGVGALIA